MSVLTTVLRKLADEGAQVAEDTIRWARNRFGDLADTPANARRVRRAIERADPQLPSQQFTNPLTVAMDQARRSAPRRVQERPLAVRPERSMAVRPEAVPALPAPGPGLPAGASKPRGGQFVPDVPLRGAQTPNAEEGSVEEILNQLVDNYSPEEAARLTAAVTPETFQGYRPWLERALTRYYKRDFGAPDDPLRELAAQGLHYDPDMTPEKWTRIVNDYLTEDPIGMYTVPGTPGYDAGAAAEMLNAAPWLAKQPATDMLYGISSGGLDLADFNRTMQDAIRLYPEDATDIPFDLAVRPESLERMSFPQAVERVGRINQFRVQQAADEAARATFDSPAVRTFREYAEDNPRGLRWVEIGRPEEALDISDFDIRWSPSDEQYEVIDPSGRFVGFEPSWDSAEELAYQTADYNAIEDALRFEGDTMGHCVGDYCDEVLEQGARIFSLRDAKGMPHVTLETRPGSPVSSVPTDVRAELGQQARAILDEQVAQMPNPPRVGDDRWNRTYQMHLRQLENDWLAANPPLDNIIQIKGKGNRAPVDEYLPFVQDFVKSQPWGRVGDLSNTQLVKLPDGRYITTQQMEEGMARARAEMPEVDPSNMFSFSWEGVAPYFEGFAIGGRVEAGRCW